MVGASTAKIFPFEIAVVVDPWGHDQLLVNAAASSKKNYKIIFLGIFSLPLGPGDDVVGVVEDEIVFAADEIAQQRRGVGDDIDLNPDIFLLKKAFCFGRDDRGVLVERSNLDNIFSHNYLRQQQ